MLFFFSYYRFHKRILPISSIEISGCAEKLKHDSPRSDTISQEINQNPSVILPNWNECSQFGKTPLRYFPESECVLAIRENIPPLFSRIEICARNLGRQTPDICPNRTGCSKFEKTNNPAVKRFKQQVCVHLFVFHLLLSHPYHFFNHVPTDRPTNFSSLFGC